MKNINNILEKYWNAETSLQEEADLKQYFASQDVAEEHVEYVDIFQHITIGQTPTSQLDINALFNTLDQVDELITKYWNAETNLAEEKILRAYFSGTEVNSKHSEYKPLFDYFNTASKLTTDLDFAASEINNDSGIDQLLNKYWNAETSIEEEKQLKNYFSSDKVSEKHADFSDLFSYFDSAAGLSTDIDTSDILSESEYNIDKLLHKYLEANTSLKEESILVDYFNGNEVSTEHESFKELFVFYDNQKSAVSEVNLREIFESQVKEKGNAVSDETPQPKQSDAKVFSIRKVFSAVAAIFVLAFATVTLMDQPASPETKYKGKYVMLDEEAEAQEAYEITKQAFALLSKNMNQGSKTVKQSVKKAKKASIFK